MPKKITNITLHDTPDGAALTVTGGDSISDNLDDFVDTSYKLRDPGSLIIRLAAGSAWMKAAADGTRFTDNQTIKLTYDDASESYWRVYRTSISHDGQSPTIITCWPYWTMLDRRAVRVQRSPNSFVDVTLALTGLTVSDALSVVTGANYNAPPYFTAGTVASAFSSAVVNVEANGESHLALLWKLCDDLAPYNGGEPAEFEVLWSTDGSTDAFFINIKTKIGLTTAEESGGADPTLRPIDAPTGGSASSKGNRIRLKQATAARDYFNRIIPVSSTEEEPITIGQCEWGVASVSYNGGSDQTTITLRGQAFVNGIDIDASGTKYFGNDDGGYFQILSVTDEDTFVVAGDASSAFTFPGRFAADSNGQELVYLELPEASSDNVIAERTVSFGITPFVNWMYWPDRVAAAGLVSADLSDWTSGMPDGWDKVEITDGSTTTSPTITEVTDPQYVRYGTSSAKVEASAGLGISADVTLQPTQRNPYYSCYVNLYVESGRIRVTMVDGAGTEWPTGEEQAESNSKELRGISIGGMEPVNSDASPFTTFTATLKIVALTEGTVFYVDSACITNTSFAVPYRAVMGLSEMWRAAARYLAENGGSLSSYDCELFDVTHFETGSYSEIEIGSYVRIRDAWNGSSYDLSVDARVTELRQREHPVDGRFQKFIKVSTRRDTASSRLLSRRASANTPGAAKSKTESAVNSSGGALSQQYHLGTNTAGETVTGVVVPLRRATASMQVSAAYIMNADAISADGTNFITVTLKNETQGVSLGSFSTDTNSISAVTPHSLTLTANASSVASGDVLTVEIGGTGTGQAIEKMCIVLETGGIGPSAEGVQEDIFFVGTDDKFYTMKSDFSGETDTGLDLSAYDVIDIERHQVNGTIYGLDSNGDVYSWNPDGTGFTTVFSSGFTDLERILIDSVNDEIVLSRHNVTAINGRSYFYDLSGTLRTSYFNNDGAGAINELYYVDGTYGYSFTNFIMYRMAVSGGAVDKLQTGSGVQSSGATYVPSQGLLYGVIGNAMYTYSPSSSAGSPSLLVGGIPATNSQYLDHFSYQGTAYIVGCTAGQIWSLDLSTNTVTTGRSTASAKALCCRR